MAAKETLEEWVFDQNLFKEPAEPVELPTKVRPGRKPKKDQDTAVEDGSGDEPQG